MTLTQQSTKFCKLWNDTMEEIKWVNVCWLLLLVAGHNEILVALINRMHAPRLACGTLRQLRHVHAVLIPAFPLALLWFVGVSGPRLLFGGPWSDLPIGWAVSHLVLAIIYFLLVSPIGLAMRLFGRDKLELRFEASLPSYWVEHDPGGDTPRYFRQS